MGKRAKRNFRTAEEIHVTEEFAYNHLQEDNVYVSMGNLRLVALLVSVNSDEFCSTLTLLNA